MSSKKYAITAIIYDKQGKVLSVGRNSYVKTHPRQSQFAKKAGHPLKIYLHAEIAAGLKLRAHHKPHKMVIFRYKEDGSPGNAEPCSVCRPFINLLNIKIVEHT